MRNIFGFFTMLGFLGIVGIMCVASGALGIEGVKQFDALDFSAVGMRSTAVPAAPAALEPILGPSATPTPAVELAAPAEAAAAPSGGVLIVSTESTKFYYEVDGVPYDIRPGTYLLLEFEQEGSGNEGWYGVQFLGQKGFVHMYEFDLPWGIYTQEDLRDLLPWGNW